MDVRALILFVLACGGGWACSAAKQMAVTDELHLSQGTILISDVLATQLKYPDQEQEDQAPREAVRNEKLCLICEEFVSQAVDFLSHNMNKIFDLLDQACSRAPALKQQCMTLVDYYAPFFFHKFSNIHPKVVCRKINLCREVLFISSKFQEDRCGICHLAVSQVLIKLKNPDSQLEIIELLLKGCDAMEHNAAKCKRLVFEYGPAMLYNAQQFLETTDICTLLHACDARAAAAVKADS